MNVKLSQLKHHWYRLGHNRAANGDKGGRVYIIECGGCAVMYQMPPHNLTEEAMRKRMISYGWEIGRTASHNRCPTCIKKRAEKQSAASIPAPPPPPKPFLQDAWESEPQDHQVEFLQWFLKTPLGKRLTEEIVETYGPTLDEAWDIADADKRAAFLAAHAPPPPPYAPTVRTVVREAETLCQHYNRSNHKERETLVSYLEQAGWLKQKTLVQHWDSATHREREPIEQEIIRRYRATHVGPQPVAAPRNVVEPVRRSTEGTVRKTDLARELNVEASVISGYLARGMPVRPDNLLDRAAAIAWIENPPDGRKTIRHRPVRAFNPEAEPQETRVKFGLDNEDALAQLAKKLFGDAHKEEPAAEQPESKSDIPEHLRSRVYPDL